MQQAQPVTGPFMYASVLLYVSTPPPAQTTAISLALPLLSFGLRSPVSHASTAHVVQESTHTWQANGAAQHLLGMTIV